MAKAALDSGKKDEAHAAVAQVLQIEPDNVEARRIEKRLQRRWPLVAGGVAAVLLVLVGFLVLRPDPGTANRQHIRHRDHRADIDRH